MSKKKYETAVEKAKRYESEVKAGYYLYNGKMVPMTEERATYCASYINEVRNAQYGNDKNADSITRQIQSGKAAALNQIRKENNYKKRKKEEKIANKVNARNSKKISKNNNSITQIKTSSSD